MPSPPRNTPRRETGIASTTDETKRPALRTGVPQRPQADDREPSSMRRYVEEVARRFWPAEVEAGRPADLLALGRPGTADPVAGAGRCGTAGTTPSDR